MNYNSWLKTTTCSQSPFELIQHLTIVMMLSSIMTCGCSFNGSTSPSSSREKNVDASALPESMTAVERTSQASPEGTDDLDMEVALESSEETAASTTEPSTTGASPTGQAATESTESEKTASDNTGEIENPAETPTAPSAPTPPAPPLDTSDE